MNRVAYFLLLGVALAFVVSVRGQSNYTEDDSAESQEDQYDEDESLDLSSEESYEDEDGEDQNPGAYSDYAQDEGAIEEEGEEEEEEKEVDPAVPHPPCEPEYMFQQLETVCAKYRDEDLSELEEKCKKIDLSISEIRSMITLSDSEANPLIEKDDTTWTQKLSYPAIVLKGLTPEDIDYARNEDDKDIADCNDALGKGHQKPGVYLLNPSDSPYNVRALCVNGWTVVQRRFDGSEDFNRDFDAYMAGFGNFSGEFILGLENLHRMTKSKDYTLRVDAKGSSGKWYYAVYDGFSLSDEKDDYRLSLGNMTAGNYFDGFEGSREQMFSTRERDNDQWRGGNCAGHFGGGWWASMCTTNLNQMWCRSGCLRWADKRVVNSIIRIKPTAAVTGEDLAENPNPGGLSLDEIPA